MDAFCRQICRLVTTDIKQVWQLHIQLLMGIFFCFPCPFLVLAQFAKKSYQGLLRHWSSTNPSLDRLQLWIFQVGVLCEVQSYNLALLKLSPSCAKCVLLLKDCLVSIAGSRRWISAWYTFSVDSYDVVLQVHSAITSDSNHTSRQKSNFQFVLMKTDRGNTNLGKLQFVFSELEWDFFILTEAICTTGEELPYHNCASKIIPVGYLVTCWILSSLPNHWSYHVINTRVLVTQMCLQVCSPMSYRAWFSACCYTGFKTNQCAIFDTGMDWTYNLLFTSSTYVYIHAIISLS